MSSSIAQQRHQGLTKAGVLDWLNESHSPTKRENYFHSRYSKSVEGWNTVSDLVAEYFRSAHDDAIQRFRRIAGMSLHPTGQSQPLPSPYDQYPFGFPDIAVQGLFGEVLAGLLAETCGAAGFDNWEVPAHLFHTHIIAFQQLEQQSQSGITATTLFGRTGDDCLAFRRDPKTSEIVSVLYCEAKCTTRHNISLVQEAHAKAATSGIVDIFQLIEALASRNSTDADEWTNALRVLHGRLHSNPSVSIDRSDAVYYLHGQAPIQRATWIDSDNPIPEYTAARHLHAIEVHLSDVLVRVRSIYCPQVWT